MFAFCGIMLAGSTCGGHEGGAQPTSMPNIREMTFAVQFSCSVGIVRDTAFAVQFNSVAVRAL